MKDYKKLIEELRDFSYITISQKAADAIEQLVRERDAAMDDLKECVDCQVCKSYDVEDNVCIAKNCRCGEDWEWRGIK